MDTSHRRYLDQFRQTNLDAGADADIVDLCLCYVRRCFSKDLSPDFDAIKPTVQEILSDPVIPSLVVDNLKAMWEVLDSAVDIPRSLAHLILWYHYNLASQGCITLLDTHELAEKLGMEYRDLCYIASDAFPGYVEFEIPKSSGKMRQISAPVPKLRWIQRWILENILQNIPLRSCATAYVRDRSIIHNAAPHTQKAVIVKLDLEDFFPSITFARVLGVYQEIGYIYPIAVLLSQLSCSKGRLPQGAPTSPALSNLVCRRLDSRLLGLAERLGFNYTRYADDITFSGNIRPEGLIRAVEGIIQSEGFVLAKHKTRIARPGQSQRVTGLVVNDKVNVPRQYYRWLRAIVHNCQTSGVRSQNRDADPAFKARLYGHSQYILGINPRLGRVLLDQLDTIDWDS